MTRSLGVYVGSFNPWHLGHLDILEKSQAIFDEVIIGQGRNPDKPAPQIPTGVHCAGFDRYLHNSKFFQYEGLTTDFVKQFIDQKTRVSLIRGLRSPEDYMAEIRQVQWMKQIYPDLNVVFIPSEPDYWFISSSELRKVNEIAPHVARRFTRW